MGCLWEFHNTAIPPATSSFWQTNNCLPTNSNSKLRTDSILGASTLRTFFGYNQWYGQQLTSKINSTWNNHKGIVTKFFAENQTSMMRQLSEKHNSAKNKLEKTFTKFFSIAWRLPKLQVINSNFDQNSVEVIGQAYALFITYFTIQFQLGNS